MSAAPTMLAALADELRGARQRAGVSTFEIAFFAGVDVSTVRRFERGRAWPRDPDQLVDAYARATRLAPHALWRAAIARSANENPKD